MLRYFLFFFFLFFILLSIHGAAAGVNGSTMAPKWKTLTGSAPAVIAHGGFSGLLPDSSGLAYQVALNLSLPNVILFCDLQLTKDGYGLCKSELRLENSTTISSDAAFPKGQKTYTVNGESMTGWFSIDFTADELLKDTVSLVQNIYIRSNAFDGSMPIMMVEDVAGLRPQGPETHAPVWLNVQYYTFFKQNGIDAAEYISAIPKDMNIITISSPEVGFLKLLNTKLPRTKAKLIFRFLQEDVVEPSTNLTYGSLLKDLNAVKSFASGILVPKGYIWPVGSNQYLEPSTSLVLDAHKLGLEVYASDFANDFLISSNYSFDPNAEYLQFIDNGDFSVDGVLTDFPPTASEAIACLAHYQNNTPPLKDNPLIITHNGASGIFPGCTDLAYQKAVEDGADIIDCSVQMSKDGVPFCLASPDLLTGTTAMASFMPRASRVPEIQPKNGIFSFDLTWSEIQSLKPQMNSPFAKSGLERNPAAKNQGKLMSLPDFLDFAKNSSVKGILIDIENAPFLASKKGLSIVDTVSSALTNASYDKNATQQVFIQSSDTSVLSKFMSNPGYKRVLLIEETITGFSNDSLNEIKKFADAVTINRESIVVSINFFLARNTDTVNALHRANISVFVKVIRNEVMALAFDYGSDPLMEIASYVNDFAVNGILTEFPATAKTYLRSPCADLSANLPYTIVPPRTGDLVLGAALPPAPAPPGVVLAAADVVDPPLPPVVAHTENTTAAAPTAEPKLSGGPPVAALNADLSLFMLMLSLMMCMSYT